MNALIHLRKDMPLSGLFPLKYWIYVALLSNVSAEYNEEEDIKYAVSSLTEDDIYDRFSDWSSPDSKHDELEDALDALEDSGLVWFDNGHVYVGEIRGRRFFPYSESSSLFEDALELMDDSIKKYGNSKSAKDKSRSRYIRERIDRLMAKGVENMKPLDFTELHSYLYEIYTGGQIYTLRNKAESFQTNNMLKAYDRFNVFAILVEGTLRYDSYRSHGVPTITNVACMKDDVFRALTKKETFGSKDYMRDSNENSEF